MQDAGFGYPDPVRGTEYVRSTEYALPTYLNTGVSHPSQMGVVMDAIIAISVDYDPHCQFTHPKKKKKKRHLRTKNPTVSVFIHG